MIYEHISGSGFIFVHWPYKERELKKFLKYIRNILLIFIGIIILFTIALYFTPFQNFLSDRAESYLSNSLKTRVEIRHVSFSILNRVNLEGVYIEDRSKDTLLYAEALSGSITDWFIFKENNTLHYLRLEDAVVNLNRPANSEYWNYQFIIDAFASDKPKEKKSSLPQLDIKKISLKNVRFNQVDAWKGKNMIAHTGSLVISGDEINFKKKTIRLSKISGDDILLQLGSYKGGMPGSNQPANKNIIDTTAFNPGSWDIRLKKLDLNNTHFIHDADELPAKKGQFDGRHLDISGIDIWAKDILIVKDTLTAHLDKLSAKERSGIHILKLKADVKVSPRITELKNMYLETNRSVLRDYYAMHYTRFPDFKDYITKVRMVARFRNAHVAMADIAFFAPGLYRWDDRVYAGNFNGSGTVSALDIQDIYLSDGRTTMKGKYSMHGLPDIKTTQIVFEEGELATSYQELTHLFPEIKKLNIRQFETLSRIQFNGDVRGVFNKLTLNGVLASNLGSLKANQLALDYSGKLFRYKGNIVTERFDFGPMFPDAKIGTIGMNMDIEGDGFNYKQNHIQAKGSIEHFDYNQYTYHNVDIDAHFHSGSIIADVNSKDPNAILDIKATIKNLETIPDYDIAGDVEWIDFRQLGFGKQAIRASGNIEALLKGNNLKNIEGEARLKNLTLIRELDTLNYTDFVFRSERDGLSNNVSFISENLKVTANGTFFLDDLVNSTRAFLAYYMPEFISPPSMTAPEQEFRFSIEAENPDAIVSIFVPELKLTKGLNIKGHMDGAAHTLTLDGTVPFIQFDNFSAENILITAAADPSGLNLTLNASSFSTAQKEMISQLTFNSTLNSNNLQFNINTTSSNAFGTARISGSALARSDSFYLKIAPSEFFFNNNKWDIEGGNTIVFAKDFIDFQDVMIGSDKQHITINPDAPHHEPGIAAITLQKINIRPILEMLDMEEMPVEGNISGGITAKNIPDHIYADFDLRSNTLQSNGVDVGYLELTGSYDNAKGTLLLNAPSGMYDPEGKIELEGTLVIDEEKKSNVDFRARGNNANLRWAEPFTSGLVKNLSGRVNGELKVKGQFPTPDIDGKAILKEAHFTPEITGVKYTLPDATVDITSTLFTISDSKIYDDARHEGSVSGSIAHDHFSNLRFTLRMNSDNIKVLDLREYEGENFYGTVYANVRLTLRGPLTDMNMNITAKPTKNSKLFIPLKYGTDISTYDYITFKKDDQAEPVAVKEKKSRLTLNIDALATPDLETEIILDPLTDEVINGKGSGSITMFIPPDGDLRLNGSYIIESGYYDFTFNQLQLMVYKERFNINSGSVINWDGNIAAANVDVKANTKVRTRLYELIQDDLNANRITIDETELQDSRLPQNVNIDMNMTGDILSPDLKFKINLEESRSIGTYAYQKLQRINSDDKDLLNQVAFLLLIDQFVPPDGFNTTLSANASDGGKLTEMLSNLASSQVSNIANKLLNTDNFFVNLRYKNYNLSDREAGSLNYLNWNEAGVSVSTNLWNDRFFLDVGGVYNWGAASGGGVSDNIAGDFRLQYLLTPDGKLRLNLFRTTSFDPVNLQNIGRHGAGISYRKSFNNLADFFGLKRRMEKQQAFETDSLPPKRTVLTDTLPAGRLSQSQENDL